MKCPDPLACKCLEHVTPETHVPSCPSCRWPLVPAAYDATAGVCLLACDSRAYRNPSDPDVTNPWKWLPRDLFNGSDLSPGNGFQPIEITEG